MSRQIAPTLPPHEPAPIMTHVITERARQRRIDQHHAGHALVLAAIDDRVVRAGTEANQNDSPNLARALQAIEHFADVGERGCQRLETVRARLTIADPG